MELPKDIIMYIASYLKSSYVTKEAKNITKIYNNNIVLVKEKTSHDGYDKYGPKSDIYDLYIVYYDDNFSTFNVNHWHKEYWYDNNYEKYCKVK